MRAQSEAEDRTARPSDKRQILYTSTNLPDYTCSPKSNIIKRQPLPWTCFNHAEHDV